MPQPDAAKNLETLERIEIQSRDGIALVGHWYPCDHPKRVILAMHGWRTSWVKNFGALADFWHENGCSVLFADQRCHGESGGAYIGFGLLERYDCLDWLNWLNDQGCASLPVYVMGIHLRC